MKWDIENQKIVAKYLNRLAGVYEVAIKKAVGLGYSVTNYNSDKPFSFADYPVTNKKADTLFSQMAYEVQSIVNGGTESAWLAANTVNDGIVDKYFAKSGLSKEQLSKYYDRNLNALAAYQNRIDGGVTLSDRVWKYTGQFKNEIELAVSVGIGEGRSAAEVSRDIRQYLQQPDKLFHKVKNKYGQLVLSKSAKAYHPGQGVYRSSYKNALRLTRTEINMSFHNADYERWNTLDFIAGYRVVLSKAHPEYDICDELQGEYPKTFAFWGWHVQCMCHTEPILSPQNEFVENLAKQLKGEDITGYVPGNKITQMPSNFKKWALDNQDRIAKAKSMPYFIDKNFKGTNVADWFKTAEKTAENIVDQQSKIDSVISILENAKVEYNHPKYIENKLSESEIIERIAGGDMTKGSCSSLAFAYAGNKSGFDVLDFRDGMSRSIIAKVNNIMEIADKVGGVVASNTNDFKKAVELLKTVSEGKEYYFTCGAHAAIVRKIGTSYEYLELQSKNSNGFKPLTNMALKQRFGAKQTHSMSGRKYDTKDCIIDINLLKNEAGFRKLLGYINTSVGGQNKGALGSIK